MSVRPAPSRLELPSAYKQPPADGPSKEGREPARAETSSATPVQPPAIQILMLGDCTLATSYLPEQLRPEARLMEALATYYPHEQINIVNEALDGESIAHLLRRYERLISRYQAPDYILVRYGINDRREAGVEGFRHWLRQLLERLHGDFPRARIVLETGIYVDYPAHYEFDRNAVLLPVFQVVHEIGKEYGLPVVDVYERMRRETEQGNWDLRVRGYGVVDEEIPVFGPGLDHMFGDDVRWFTNIHPNPIGVAIIADEEARTFAAHWPDTLRLS